ncbi:MAG TPA: hypothetical protein VIK33_01015, partial [Anaerolineae bacterium]
AYAIAPRAIGHAGAGHITLVEAWAWIPLAVWAARRSPILSGAALGMCALADLRAATYAGLAVAAYVLFAPAEERSTQRATRIMCYVKTTGRFIAILLVAALISAATWLPALTLAGETTRASLSPGEAGLYSLPLDNLLGVLVVNRGDPEGVTYVGLAVLVLGLIGLRSMWREQRRAATWLLVLIVLGVFAALGANTPVYQVLYRLPGVSLLRVPGRAWFLVAFAMALAGGMGVDAMMRWASERRPARRWVLAGWMVGWFALLFGAGGALIALATRQPGVERVAPSLIGLAIFLPAIIALVLLRSSGRLAPTRFGVAALVLVALDLMWVGWGRYRVVPRGEVFDDGRAVAEYIRPAFGDASHGNDFSYRVYSPSYSLPQHVAQAYGLRLADGIDPMQLARTARFMQAATGLGEWGYSVTLPAFEGLERDEDIRTWLKDVVPDPMLLGLLGVRYVVAHFPIAQPDLIEVARIDGAIVYQNRRAMPQAWIVSRVDVADSQSQAIEWLTSHDAREAAVVEGGYALSVNGAAREAQVDVYDPDRIVVSARGPGLLILSEVYAHDWRASIDGAATTVLPTDAVLRGVYLPEGEHRVEFVYDPMGVKSAVAVSGIGVGGLMVGWMAGWLARRRGR